MFKKEAKNSQGSSVVDFGGLDRSPGCAPLENELRRYSAQRCTTVPEIVSYSGPGQIVDCKDPNLQEWMLQLNNTPHTRGYTMKVEQRRPRLQPEDIDAVAHKDVSEREALQRLNRGDKTILYPRSIDYRQSSVLKQQALPLSDVKHFDDGLTALNLLTTDRAIDPTFPLFACLLSLMLPVVRPSSEPRSRYEGVNTQFYHLSSKR